jgi:hypothetical protein
MMYTYESVPDESSPLYLFQSFRNHHERDFRSIADLDQELQRCAHEMSHTHPDLYAFLHDKSLQ